MKIPFAIALASIALTFSGLGQTPTVSPAIAAPASPAVVTSPTVSPKDADDLESRIEKKVKKGLHITIGDDEEERDTPGHHRGHVRVNKSDGGDDSALMAIPIVGIIFTTLFGAPVLIVGLILFFSYWKQRSLHRTVRLMVEKGQPVPEGLFSTPPPAVRQRSDMRRGIVMVMVGLGVMIFFAAMNDWEGGSWALGIIPFLIGCGYLLVWKLEGSKRGTDNPPPLP